MPNQEQHHKYVYNFICIASFLRVSISSRSGKDGGMAVIYLDDEVPECTQCNASHRAPLPALRPRSRFEGYRYVLVSGLRMGVSLMLFWDVAS